MLRDDLDADHYGRTSVDISDYNEWFELRFVVDFSDLSRMGFWFNESQTNITYVGNSGTADLDLTNANIKLGQQYDGTVEGHMWIKDLIINNREIRAP